MVNPQYQSHVFLKQVLNGSDGFLPAGFDQDSEEVAGQEVQEKSSTDTPQQKTNVQSKARSKKSFRWNMSLDSNRNPSIETQIGIRNLKIIPPEGVKSYLLVSSPHSIFLAEISSKLEEGHYGQD